MTSDEEYHTGSYTRRIYAQEVHLPQVSSFTFRQCTFKMGTILIFPPRRSNVTFNKCEFKSGAQIRFSDPESLQFYLCKIEPGVIWNEVFEMEITRTSPEQSIDMLPDSSYLCVSDGKSEDPNWELTPNIIIPPSYARISFENWGVLYTVRSLEILMEAMWQNPLFSASSNINWGAELDGKLGTFERLKKCRCFSNFYPEDPIVLAECKCRHPISCLFVVSSAKEVPRVGRHSALRKLPKDLVRVCAGFLM